MTSPISDRAFSYEAVPTNISSQEPVLCTSNPNPMEIAQPVSSVYNVPQGPPTVIMSTAAPQWNVNVPLPQVSLPTTFYETFLKGKPFALGVVLICAATYNVIMGIGMICFSIYRLSLISGNPFWAAVAYIITGIITLAAYSKPSICQTGGIVVHALTLVNNLLILCVSIFLGVFGCLSLGNVQSVTQVFLLHNGAIFPVSALVNPSPPLTQYPIPYFVQGDVKNQPTVKITQSS
ncbi:uncharacterized protein [Aquarana catesbeiana]|uniref:uncharacterized protein isoform X2 n=1 Tax=Aquarana catesbeiana TaxID=8400 RepID=UPI003CC95957